MENTNGMNLTPVTEGATIVSKEKISKIVRNLERLMLLRFELQRQIQILAEDDRRIQKELSMARDELRELSY